MPDLTLAQLKQAYDASLEQMAAESFLIIGMAPLAYTNALRLGNNLEADPNAADLQGKLRMTLEQAQAFVNRYDIIDTYQNDATGFSAVALRDNANPNRVVLAVRSTEINNDRARDVAADFQIFTSGFAFDQILSAQDFLVRVQPQLQPGEKIDLVGYSLSGNVVRTMAAMYPDLINQGSGSNVVFNATGLGGFSDPTGLNRPRSVVLQEMMSLYRQIETDPSSVTNVPLLLLPLQLTAIAAPPLNRTDPNGNVYPSPRNDFAEAYVQNKYTTFYNDFGTTVAEPSFSQYFGVALSGFDAAAVANSGSHPVPVGVAIEGQPVVEIPGVASKFDYLNTHSLTLIADSLRLQVLFKEIDPNLSMDAIQSIFQASSASSANTLLGRAEKDTLENALDVIRKALLPVDPNFQPTPSSEIAGGFGLISNRTIFHTNITAIENVLPPQPSPYQIESLVNRPLEEVKGNALLDDVGGKGLAYRYALKELNPFAIIGPTYAQHTPNGELALFNASTGTGSITLDYIQDRSLFLAAKVALNQTNLDLPLNPFTLTHYYDNTTGYDIPSGLSIPPGIQREYIFGSDIAETIAGGSLFANDHLYGGDGVDTLLGNGGNDYLQGDEDNDTLNGGSGADRMFGGQGNDTYVVDNAGDSVTEGLNNGSDTVQSSVSFTLGANVEDLTLTGAGDINGTGNELDNLIIGNNGVNRLKGLAGTDTLQGGIGADILEGGTGNNDLLEGGAGFDTYIYNAGDGIDRIEDSDASGQIIFNGHRLLGGIHDSNDPSNTYKSLDGLTTYVLSGTDLIVNGVLTVNADFQSGQFGIQLDDLSDFPTNTGIPTGPFLSVITGTDGRDIMLRSQTVSGPGEALFGLGGNDDIYGFLFGDDLLDGGAGNDVLAGREGNDYLDGGVGDDHMGGGSGKDVLMGGAGDDAVFGDFYDAVGTDDRDYLDGGEGADYLWGGWGTDVLRGGDGNDSLRGDNLPDGWPQRIYSDLSNSFIPVPGPAVFSATGAADFLDGGSGNDLLVGDGGNDILSGGADNDQLFGDDEAGYLVVPGDDMLDGGAGDDLLAGGDGNDSLSGGTGIDQLFGDKGIDVLDGGDGVDTLHGGDGADQIFGGAGDDLVFGDGLNNPSALSAAGGADFLDGGAGNDHLEGGIGGDVLFGGTENDVLFGDEGADSLFGDEGDDELQGGDGIDLLGGDAGDDRLFGQAGADTLYGDEGNDILAGNDGNDTLVGGIGNDILEGSKGNDVLVGGAGHDTYNVSLGDGQDTITDRALAGEGNVIQFFSGITLGSLTFIHDQAQQTLTIQVAGGDSIRLLGFDPNTLNYVVDTLDFADGTVVALADQLPLPGGLIEGTDDNNVIRTGSGDDTIFAGAGNDAVIAGGGNDVILGQGGNDFLAGGPGQDRYVFNAGDGTDTISDTAGEGNRIVFGGGLSSSAVTLGRGSNGSLEIRGSLPGDRLQFGGLVPGASSIETFEFADGTVLTFDQLIARGIDISGTSGPDTITGTSFIDRISAGGGNDVVRGGDGNDVLNGEAGNDSLAGEAGDDVLVGGAGDDQLEGGEGADTYRFNLGDGIDSISDSNVVGEESRVVFGPGITSSTVTLTTDFGQVVVRPGTANEGIKNGANGSDVQGFRAVDLFEFADGSTLTYADLVARGFDLDGTEFDDFLFGTNVIDRFRGGLGNDRLEGGEGNDSYFFNLSDGVDTIVDVASGGAGNEVVFGAGIASSDLRLDLAPDQSDSSLSDLLLRVGTNGDTIQFDTFERNNVFGPRTVETFRFTDGSTLTYEQLLARGFDLTGTDGDDQISGTNVADRIVAGDGADVLRSGLGDDTLDGGAGNDRLVGGQGNDTYVFGPGSGQDAILEFQGSQDTIRMATGVAPSDVVVTRSNNDLVLSLNGGADQLTVSLYFLASPLQIEQVQFADGTVWDQAFLQDLTQPAITGTGGSDSLMGTNGDDRLAGLAGDDQLTGLAGNDLLDGGTGADQLTGSAGDDTYIVDDAGDVVTELAGEGIDTIQSSVTRTLDTNVERLTLTGAAAINGTGNDLDNLLTSNSTANVLAGGLGNDTFVVGAGDQVVELAGEGTDTVQTGVSAMLGANVENLTLTGNTSLVGTGNALDNVLQADGSVSVLAGGDGNDTYVIGPNGDDDILVETATGGIDTVIAAHDYRLPANIENLTLLDAAIPDFGIVQGIGSVAPRPAGTGEGIGNELNNTLIGGRASNVLDGGLGADTMIGGDGNETYIVDNISDIVIEQVNEGTDSVLSAVSYQLSANVENLTLVGTAPISGIGNALNNDLRGNEAPNVLDGGAGDDSLQGFGGADTYLFGRGSGSDIVFDSSVAGEVDTMQMAADIAPSEVGVYQRPGDLVLAINGTTDEFTLSSFFGPSEYAQKQVRFADGTVWNEAELRARAVAVGGTTNGTTGNDSLVGGVGHDTLVGNAGNDTPTGGIGNDFLYGDATSQSPFDTPVIGNDQLTGGLGNDVLRDFQGANLFDGGAGNDSLYLGAGQDTVLFGRGSGVDFVTLDNNGGDIDIIQLAADLSPSDVVIRRHYPDYHFVDLLIPSTGDKLTVVLSTNYPTVGLESTQAVVRFANGNEWSLAWSPPDLSFATGTQFDDVVSGVPGEELRGLAGNDTYSVGAGNTPIVELPGEGTDTVQSTVDYTLPANVENLFLADNFTNVGPFADNATGNALDNLIIGNTRDNVLDGGVGNDVLVGGLFRAFEVGLSETGSDILIGGEGNDVLMADGGNFAFYSISGLDGGESRDDVPREADDLFIGGVGNDTYILHSQQQTVAEFANEGTDTVEAHVSYALGENMENLTLVGLGSLNGTGNGFDNVLIGNGEANVLDGREGHDTLWGGNVVDTDSGVAASGNDILIGGTGHDTYLFKVGDGIDAIEDIAVAGEGNRIQFGTGIARTDLTFTQDQLAWTLTIQVGSSGTDQLRLINFDPTGANGSLVVETLAFADGSTASLASLLGLGGPVATNGDDTITTGAGNDVVDALDGNDLVDTGAGNDTITGGTGNDQLTGGTGNDTYLFNVGDGVDTITDTAAPGEGNTLEFGAGITPTDLTLGIGSLLIRVGTNGDAIHVTPFDPNDALGAHAIETFRFADRTTLSYSQLIARGFDLTGTAGNDAITGTNVTDRITGLAGNDTIDAGEGNDALRGGAGHDTYLFNVGDGLDTIEDTTALGEGNRIQFGAGISQGTLTFIRDEVARTLTIQVGSNGADQLVLTNFDPTGANGSHVAEMLAFADGSTVNLVDLFPSNHAPTVATPLTDQTVQEDALFTVVVPSNTFADEDTGDVLTLTASLADGTALPAWLTFDAATRMLSGTPDDAQVGTLNLRVTATDTGNLSVSDSFTLTVNNVNEAPTVAVPLADQQATEDAPFSLVVPTGTFADVDAGDTLTYSATLANEAALPTWLSFDPATRTFSGTPLNGDVGTLTIAVKATDSGSLSVTDTFALAIQNVNDAPTVAAPLADQQAATGTLFNLVVPTGTFADIDAGDTLTYSATLATGAALPTWLSFNPATRTFSGTPQGSDVGTLDVRITATDTGNLNVSDVFELAVTIQDQVLTGTAGSDALTGGAGNDQLFGLAGNDTLQGGAGNDLLDGGTGVDAMTGGTGSDTYIVDNVGDVVTELANEGTDTVQSSLLTYTLGANVENLTLTGTGPSAGFGNALNNLLVGTSGANLLVGKGGADTMRGGAGDDLYFVDNVGDTVIENAGEGTLDTVSSSVAYALSANVENLVLTGSAAINGAGNNLGNVLTGNGAANVLTGGAGNDIYVVGPGDTVVEAAHDGTDTVVSATTSSLSVNVENLTLIGFSTINGTGNALDNVLNGLLNLAGNTLTGGAGNDTYIVGGGDSVVEAANGGTDTVQSGLTHTLGANVENLTLTGSSAINGTGNSLNNTMTGNSGNNVLSGAGGNDTLRGGAGNDTVNGGGGNDTFLFGRGDGQDLLQDNSGTADKLRYDAGINPLDLVLSRQANDLRLTIHGSSDQITVQNWYTSVSNRTETIQAGNGQTLLSTQVDQLIQAMAQFSANNNGITWDEGIVQKPLEVQEVLAANGWQ